MGKLNEHASFTDSDEKGEHARTMTSSSTEADLEDHRTEVYNAAHHKETEVVGTPDIDHEEIEEAVPGHELDVELAKVSSSKIGISWPSWVFSQPQSWQNHDSHSVPSPSFLSYPFLLHHGALKVH
jgi:hypothetical protein